MDDLRPLEALERFILGSTLPAAPLKQELERKDATYLLAARRATDEELQAHSRTSDKGSGVFKNLLNVFQNHEGPSRFSEGGEVLSGMAGIWHMPDHEAHIVIIGTHPEERRKGVGELLLISSIEEAAVKKDRSVTLEVRISNEPAISLYEKYKFAKVGVRKRYYTDNGEDSLIMTTPPINSSEYTRILQKLINAYENRWGLSDRLGV